MRDICSSPVMNCGGRKLFSLKYSYTARRYSGLFIGLASFGFGFAFGFFAFGFAVFGGPCISPLDPSAAFGWFGLAFSPPLTRLSRAAASSEGSWPRR